MKTGIVTGLTLILGVALCVILLGPGHLESAEQQLVVTAKHLHKVPALLDDPVWQQVPAGRSLRERQRKLCRGGSDGDHEGRLHGRQPVLSLQMERPDEERDQASLEI